MIYRMYFAVKQVGVTIGIFNPLFFTIKTMEKPMKLITAIEPLIEAFNALDTYNRLMN